MKARAVGVVGNGVFSRRASTTTSFRSGRTRGSRPQPFLDTSNATNAKEADSRHTDRRTVVFLAQKQKEEILALHEEDPLRWSATVLAARFGAPRENVQMLLRLGQERNRRDQFVKSLPKDQKDTIQKLRDQSISAWSELSTEGSPFSRRVQFSYLRSQSSSQHRAPGPRPTISVDELREVALGKDGDANDQHTMESTEAGAGDGGDDAGMERSEWARKLDHLCENVELDTIRRTSFAFIEVGRGKNIYRGVWLREGQTGKLRIADEDERKLLLNKVNMRDAKAFRQQQ